MITSTTLHCVGPMLLGLALAGCRESVVRLSLGAQQVSAAGVVLHPVGDVAPPQAREHVCVDVSPTVLDVAGRADTIGVFPMPVLSAVLQRADGSRDTLGTERAGGWYAPNDGPPGRLCVMHMQHAGGSPYVALELRAPTTVPVQAVRWWGTEEGWASL